MSHVSISAGLVTIGAVEHYGKLSKTLHNLKSLFLPSSKPSAKEEEEKKERQREEAKRRGEVAKRVWDKTPLPHEGKRKEDMTDEERVERGAALVARAMARGLAQPKEEDTKARGRKTPEKKSSISPDADLAARLHQRVAGSDVDGVIDVERMDGKAARSQDAGDGAGV
ncbi:hypothetical protein EXIGLDRAFT_732505 [Exidia glandulosa HHB12029]|uniref:Uncharacterized protein n=1 Tax=Exidia glandulosa HHB12029 TaxID=1314781 RepID=A0A165KQP9_EXIGL|nr:hypothetical protein EXIGLDRAFT_732505 [Exidia glandulosa HHB12029]